VKIIQVTQCMNKWDNTQTVWTSCKVTFLPPEEEEEPTLIMVSFLFLSMAQ